MKEYKELVKTVLKEGQYKENRTGVDTVSYFGYSYKVDLSKGFPLLTTKDMSGFRWNSLIHELIWYLSGEEHIRSLREETGIWDAWADEKGRLDTAYGRFWRRFPVPAKFKQLDGESWPENESKYLDRDEYTFDQIGFVIDELKNNPNSRRLVINAWHPANAATSTLPPCHYSWVLNVQDNKLNTHLTQRSGDVALGIPFNIACYSILTQMIAQRVGLEVGEFSHTIVDAHIYCGEGDRGSWYENNLEELKTMLIYNSPEYSYTEIVDWLCQNAPDDPDTYDHIPGLLRQLSRDERSRPRLKIKDKDINDLIFNDFELYDYDPHGDIYFGVAE